MNKHFSWRFTMYCPNCGQQQPDESKFCSNCDANLQAMKQKACPHCGKQIQNKSAKFCEDCGHQLDQPIKPNETNKVTSAPEKKRKPIPAWRIVLGCLGLLLLMGSLTSTAGITGFLIWLVFIAGPFLTFVIVYNSNINQ